jgi:hypothetical protein
MIKYLWQLPQHLLALILILITKAKFEKKHETSKVYRTEKNFGVSLGSYIIVSIRHNEKTIKHEYGHSIQSLCFGPFYLIVIGIPSITMNLLSLFFWKLGYKKFALNYYNRWPEDWADILGGVER